MNSVDDRIPLDPLDPGSEDPGFWIRFHGRAMDRARGELARRQAAREWTVAEVVFHWRKTLVPVSLLAASLAGIWVYGHEEPVPPTLPVALEETLTEGLEGDAIPAILETVAELDEVAFLTSAAGF